MPTKSSDSFGTFLRSVKGGASPAAEDASRKILVALESGPVELKELLGASGLEFDRFTEALQTMRKLDLVAIQTRSGVEVAELTAEGAQLATLARQ